MKTINYHKKFYVIQGNNGNHTGHNRMWTFWQYGYDFKIAALNDVRHEISNNGDMKYGLTPIRIVTPEQIEEIRESDEQISLYNCSDISQI